MSKPCAWCAGMAVLITASGCQMLPASPRASEASAPSGPPARQLMVKLRGARTSCDASQIALLGRATAQQLEYIRPMSGDACVIRQKAETPKALADGFRRLVQHPTVDWVEVDGVMKAF